MNLKRGGGEGNDQNAQYIYTCILMCLDERALQRLYTFTALIEEMTGSTLQGHLCGVYCVQENTYVLMRNAK